jgi:DNA-binding transcriptional regulator YhcF (GntR family)
LPTGRQLAVQLSINYNTVTKVYLDLEREGFIVTKRGICHQSEGSMPWVRTKDTFPTKAYYYSKKVYY